MGHGSGSVAATGVATVYGRGGVDRAPAKIFDRLDPQLAAGFAKLHTVKLLDLANRKGKAPGGYQSTLNEARLPFIFMNAVGKMGCENVAARGGTRLSRAGGAR